MKFRERIGWKMLTKHIEDSKYEPNPDTPGSGTGYFAIDSKWYSFVKFISGVKPEVLFNHWLGRKDGN